MKINVMAGMLFAFVLTFLVTSCGVGCGAQNDSPPPKPTVSGANVPVAPYAKEMFTDSGTNGASEKIVTIEKVVCVFMHRPGEFTYWYIIPGTTSSVMSCTISCSQSFTINLDAEKGKSWMKYWGDSNNQNCACAFQEIHLESIDLVKGSGPSH